MKLKTKFLLLILAITSNLIHAQSVYGNNPATGHYVKSGDAKMYYEIYGEGESIVLLHGGIMGSIDEMTDFIDRLKTNYQVIAIATRGHTKSEIGTSEITYELKANDVITVINDVTKKPVIILGFSDGAYTGYKVASMYPDQIKKLIAIGAGEQVPGLRKVVFDPESMNLGSDFWKSKYQLMPEPKRHVEFLKNMEHFYNTMVASKELFNSIKCPTLLIAGERDMNAPLATVIAAYQMVPKAQLAIIPNAGHVVFMENFDAVWASVKPFIRD